MSINESSRSFFLQYQGAALTHEVMSQLRGPFNGHPVLFPNITQLHTLHQDGVTTAFISTRDRRSIRSVILALEINGQREVRVFAVRVEYMNLGAMRHHYSDAMNDIFRLLRTNQASLVRFVRPGWNRANIFGQRTQDANVARPPVVSTMALRSNAASRAQSPAPPQRMADDSSSSSSSSSSAGGHTPSFSPPSPTYSPRSSSPASSISNAGVGPMPFGSPVMRPRAAPVEPMVVVPPPVEQPFANDPPHVVELRTYLSTHNVQHAEFNTRVMQFATAHLRTVGSGVARELLAVLEPTGEPWVREFRTYLNTHDHTDPDFQGRLTRLVQAYLENLQPSRENYNFALRMFAAFQHDQQSDERRSAFGNLLARIAADVPLSGP